MSKKQKKTSKKRQILMDFDTGEILSTYNITKNDKIAISGYYIKSFPRFNKEGLNYKYEGYLSHIIELLLQYETNELRFNRRNELKLKHNHFADILNVSTKTITEIMKYFENRYYIKKNNGRYYLNPRISSKGQKVMISTVLLFIDDDMLLRESLNAKALRDVKLYKKFL